MGFSIGRAKDGSPALFISTILQSGWNEQTKTGSFGANAKDPNKSSNFKMNANEAGEMISSIRNRIPVVFFHKFNQDTTIISFTPWDKDRKIKGRNGEETYKSAAFGLSFSKNSATQFKIALEAGETEVLRLLLEDFIKQDLFHASESYKKEEQPATSKQENIKTQEPSNGFDDDDDVPF